MVDAYLIYQSLLQILCVEGVNSIVGTASGSGGDRIARPSESPRTTAVPQPRAAIPDHALPQSIRLLNRG